MEGLKIYLNQEKAVLQKLRQKFGAKANIQPTQIRLEKQVASGDVNNTFTLSSENNLSKRPTERFLGTNDVLAITHISLAVYKELELTGTAQRAGNSVLYYYPDKTVFGTLPATAANVAEFSALEAIYNGTISIKSNTYEVVNSMDCLRFRSAAITQDSATTQASSGSFHGEQRTAFVAPVLFGGNKRNEIDLKIARGADTVQIAGDPIIGKNVYVLLLDGYVVRNAAEALTLSEASDALLL